MVQKWIFLGGWLLICHSGFSQDKATYIQLYKHIAVSEMMRTGIPASIKLGQAILESACGQSDLACKANNHFGIKCGNDWSGKSYKKEDDDYEEGKLVKSCFREFSTVYDSYIAHSEFLTDPGKAKRYGFLFDLSSSDYKGWARGLSKAGYATDPQYADRLIDIIERYELFRYDTPEEDHLASVSPKSSTGRNLVLYNNAVKYAIAKEGDTPASLAERHDVTVRQIIRYNDDIHNDEEIVTVGSFVYLQPKRSKYQGRQKNHMIKSGETMISISQKYGIRLDALLKRNGLKNGDIPAPKQKIILKGKTDKPPRTINPYDIPDNMPSEKTSEQDPLPTTEVSLHPSTMADKFPVSNGVQKIKQETPFVHAYTVQKGDTLFGIASKNGITVPDLKKMNNLSENTIAIGQKLILR